MPRPHIDVGADEPRRALVKQRLTESNTARAAVLRELEAIGERHEAPLEVYATDEAGELVGGLTGTTWASWLHVDRLWVADDHRGAGLGRRLLHQAESVARSERGCGHARVETWSFQAPGFYLKQGYREVGVIEDYPPGECEHLFVKEL